MSTAPQIVQVTWDAPEVLALVRAALDEDLGVGRAEEAGDLTAQCLVSADATVKARIVAKRELVLAGLPLAERVFRALNHHVKVTARVEEGTVAAAGSPVAAVEGNARAILSAERTALNFLAHLSGIATLTRRFVEAVAGTRARIRDTRKTTPLLREIEKYAVRAGGGSNHRFGLYDAMLVKENHIALAGSVAEAVHRAQLAAASAAGLPPEMTAYEAFRPPDKGTELPVEVEVRNEAELREALAAKADCVLLDNVTPAEAARLVRIAREIHAACLIEVSGGVTLGNVRAYAEAGADFIAIGALTHSAPAADLSLLVEGPLVE
jgi:nicotinate-nucleotide pyrophosphorylase (carboxylating)